MFAILLFIIQIHLFSFPQTIDEFFDCNVDGTGSCFYQFDPSPFTDDAILSELIYISNIF